MKYIELDIFEERMKNHGTTEKSEAERTEKPE